MPRRDGTGPFGTGPIGGICVNKGTNPSFVGRGLGRAMGICAGGLGLGLGLGLRCRGNRLGGFSKLPLNADNDKDLLTRQKEILTERLKEINEQLQD